MAKGRIWNGSAWIDLDASTALLAKDSEKLGGQAPAYYAKQSDMTQAEADIAQLQTDVTKNLTDSLNQHTTMSAALTAAVATQKATDDAQDLITAANKTLLDSTIATVGANKTAIETSLSDAVTTLNGTIEANRVAQVTTDAAQDAAIALVRSDLTAALGTATGDTTALTATVSHLVKDVVYDTVAQKWTFTKEDGAKIEIDHVLDSLIKNVTYNSTTKVLTFTFDGGSTSDVNVADLIDVYTVSDTATVDMTITGNDIKADVKVSADAKNIVVAKADGLYVPETDFTATNASIQAVDDKVTILNGDVSTDGSIAKSIAGANAYTDGKIATEVTDRNAAISAALTSATGSTGAEEARAKAAELVLTNDLATEVSARTSGDTTTLFNAKAYADSLISAEVTARDLADAALQTQLTTLKGDVSTPGSVANAIKSETDRALNAEATLAGRLQVYIQVDEPVDKTGLWVMTSVGEIA